MVAEAVMFVTMIGLMMLGSRVGIAMGFILGYSAIDIFAINMVCVVASVFVIFAFWKRFIEKRYLSIVSDKTIKKIKKYDKAAFLILPALPISIALGQVGAAVAYKILYRKFDNGMFAALVAGQILRVVVSIAAVAGIIELIKIF
jgi:hypothetical protein